MEKNSNDKLDLIFKYQTALQQKLGNLEKIDESPQMKQQFINQMILALFEESVEIMRESGYKNPELVPFGWKKGQIGDTEKFKDEIADIIHFVINLCIVAKMDPDELFERYMNKNKKNHERQNDNY